MNNLDGVQVLKELGVIKDSTTTMFSLGTRDVETLAVYRDSVSGVIFIPNYYIGDAAYAAAQSNEQPQKLEDNLDTCRRYTMYKQFVLQKVVCDLGCGDGLFLTKVKPLAKEVYGIEINKQYIKYLGDKGIKCFPSTKGLPEPVDTICLFHSFEHLQFPLAYLKSIKAKLSAHGKVIIEVPHAKDFLISVLGLKKFISYTLWSQHLILHTRVSLQALLEEAGFTSILIQGVQRYGISNHLEWAVNSLPGGHKSNLSVMETADLKRSYENALISIDASDTLVAIASV